LTDAFFFGATTFFFAGTRFVDREDAFFFGFRFLATVPNRFTSFARALLLFFFRAFFFACFRFPGVFVFFEDPALFFGLTPAFRSTAVPFILPDLLVFVFLRRVPLNAAIRCILLKRLLY
jgi:hypothetical protein